jgi:glutamate-ammonia-ligase adenylyltransferase
MDIADLIRLLDQPQLAAEELRGWQLSEPARGQQILVELVEAGVPVDLLAAIGEQLGEQLPRQADADAALAALGRYVLAVRSPLSLAALMARDASVLPMLLGALSLGPRWVELLVDDPDAFEVLRQAGGRPVERGALAADVLAEVAAGHDERSVIAALTRNRRRHELRIANSEVMGAFDVNIALCQLADLAESLVEAALAAAVRRIAETHAPVRRGTHAEPRLAVIATAALGGRESDYALPLELLVVYDTAGIQAGSQATRTSAAALPAWHEQADRIARLLARLLEGAAADDGGRVTLLTLPDSPIATSAHAADDVVLGYSSFGRTWHRQQLLKARPVAGDKALGEAILGQLEPWLYRRYLNRADETGIKALKRRILLEATLHQDDFADVWNARGALRDIVATVEFLQLLSGGDEPAVRQSNTLAALAGLEKGGILSSAERQQLEGSYRFFRSALDRLQIWLGPGQTQIPADERLISRLAASLDATNEAAAFVAELRSRLNATWQTLRKLLTSAFVEEVPTTREVDLLLAPSPPAEEKRAALAPFGFEHPEQALTALNDLAREQVPFLSTRRCRHLLASILPQLLAAIAATPLPDRTLDNLVRVSNSLGGKGVLWDLFRFHSPSLQLYVKLCAASPYLSGILTTNPGMLDDLVDSLQLDKLPTRAEMAATLAELCRGVSDTLSVLHDFKNAEHLRLGVRDLLGKEDIDRTHAALADVAEVCLGHVAELEYGRLVEKYGVPAIGPGPYEGEPCRLVVLGLAKLGGREPNYHSHLDLLFLYEADGVTRPGRSRRSERTANNHFFTQLAQRVIKELTQLTPKGRLYQVETLLRPIGVGGALALPLADFAQHFDSGAAPLWQWLALCQARPVVGEDEIANSAAGLIRQLLMRRPWNDADVTAIRSLRLGLESGAAPTNLKRAAGGSLDVEFLVQMFQLQHAAAQPDVLATNTCTALRVLAAAGVLDRGIADRLDLNYRFLRRVESGLRLQEARRRHDLPFDMLELRQLAVLLGHSNPERLREQCEEVMAENRAIFDRLTPGS